SGHRAGRAGGHVSEGELTPLAVQADTPLSEVEANPGLLLRPVDQDRVEFVPLHRVQDLVGAGAVRLEPQPAFGSVDHPTPHRNQPRLQVVPQVGRPQRGNAAGRDPQIDRASLALLVDPGIAAALVHVDRVSPATEQDRQQRSCQSGSYDRDPSGPIVHSVRCGRAHERHPARAVRQVSTCVKGRAMSLVSPSLLPAFRTTVQPVAHQDGSSGPRVDFRILGALELYVDGKPVPIGGPRQRIVLAMLLSNAGEVVPVDTLVDAVWNGDPPVTGRTQVAICVAGLRKTFRAHNCPDDLLVTVAPGYRID